MVSDAARNGHFSAAAALSLLPRRSHYRPSLSEAVSAFERTVDIELLNNCRNYVF